MFMPVKNLSLTRAENTNIIKSSIYFEFFDSVFFNLPLFFILFSHKQDR